MEPVGEQNKNQHLSPMLADIQDNGPDVEASDYADGPGFTRPLDEEDELEELELYEYDDEPQSDSRNIIAILALGLSVLLGAALAWTWFDARSDRERLQEQVRELTARLDAVAAEPSLQDLTSRLSRLELTGAAPPLSVAEPLTEPLTEPQSVVLQDELASRSEANVGQTEDLTALSLPAQDSAPLQTDQAVADVAGADAAVDAPVPVVEPALSAEPPEQSLATTEPSGWSVILGSFRDVTRANAMAERLASAGEVIEVIELQRADGIAYRVAVSGLPDALTARRKAAELQDQWDLQGLWVSRD